MTTDRATVAQIAAQIDGELLPDNERWTNRFQIKSHTSDRLYVVAQQRSDGLWGCACPGWRHHRKCKHVTDVLRRLAMLAAKTPAYRNLSVMVSACKAYLDLEPAAAVKMPALRGSELDL